MSEWHIFTGDRTPNGEKITQLPSPPPWRPRRSKTAPTPQAPLGETQFSPSFVERGRTFQSDANVIEAVNAALYLRRPLLVTGKPGTGKSSLVDAVAYELCLGEPLRWPVTSRSTLRDALYNYDALGRLQAQQQASVGAPAADIGDYIELGPLGTALLPSLRPRALLIDEIDKADVDLPNDLLNAFEEGYYTIPELGRLKEEAATVRTFGSREAITIRGGRVQCFEFPFVVMTSNGERDFPAPFLRRCLRLEMPDPTRDEKRLAIIVEAHLGPAQAKAAKELIANFVKRAKDETLATDQLLNAVYLVLGKHAPANDEREAIVSRLTETLGGPLR